MLSSFKSKLNSKRGVSLVLALFLLLICAFSGTAALTAASLNFGRHNDYASGYHQQYLAVASATRLIRDELGDDLSGFRAEFTCNASLGSITEKYYYNEIEYGKNAVIGENDLMKLIWSGITEYTHKHVKDNPPGGWEANTFSEANPQERFVFNLTVADESGNDLEGMDVTVIVHLSSLIRNNIDVTVQSDDGDYALGFSMPVSFSYGNIGDDGVLRVTLNQTASVQIQRAVREDV